MQKSREDLVARALIELKKCIHKLNTDYGENVGDVESLCKRADGFCTILQNAKDGELERACYDALVLKLPPSKQAVEFILNTFLKNIPLIKSQEVYDLMKILWKTVVERKKIHLMLLEYSKREFKSLLELMLCLSFKTIRLDVSLEPVFVKLILNSCVDCLKDLAANPRTQQTKSAFNLLLLELISHKHSKYFAEKILKKCSYHVCDAIKELLNPVLISGSTDTFTFEIETKVYDVLFKLICIDLSLTTGLTNNVELCLQAGRLDRLDGIKFMLRLFSITTIPNYPNPTTFFTRLWEEFLFQRQSFHCTCAVDSSFEHHLQLTSLVEMELIGKKTPTILREQPELVERWCTMLRVILKMESRRQCRIYLVEGAIEAIYENWSLLYDENHHHMSSLISSILSLDSALSVHPYFYQNVIDTFAEMLNTILSSEMTVANKAVASRVLGFILYPCTFHPLLVTPVKSELWHYVAHAFTSKLVPSSDPAATRMDKCLKLWIIGGHDGKQQYLNELLFRCSRVRECMQSFFNEFYGNRPILVRKAFWKLCFLYIPEPNLACTYICSKLIPHLRSVEAVRDAFSKIFASSSTNNEVLSACDDLRFLLPKRGSKETQIVETFLNYIGNFHIDEESFKVLIDQLDSCLYNKDLSSSLCTDFTSAAQFAVSLLEGVVTLYPNLCYNLDVLNVFVRWMEHNNDLVVNAILQCFLKMTETKLETWNPEYTQSTLVPLWMKLVEGDSRFLMKGAIFCLASHLTTSLAEVMAQVLQVIIHLLDDFYDKVNYIRGIVALGYFSRACTSIPVVHNAVENLAVEKLLPVPDWMKAAPQQEEATFHQVHNDQSLVTEDDVVCEEERFKTLGRCARYCMNLRNACKVIVRCANIMVSDGDNKQFCLLNLQENFKHQILLAAACALLEILERNDTTPYLVGRSSVTSTLSNFTRHENEFVRRMFAEKLRRGLSPWKLCSFERGQSKGNLHPILLGLTALWGLDIPLNDVDHINNPNWFRKALEDIILSRRIFFSLENTSSPIGNIVVQYYNRSPKCNMNLAEYMLLSAIYVLILNSSMTKDPESETFSDESFIVAWRCLGFAARCLSKRTAYVAVASKEFMIKMTDTAKLHYCGGTQHVNEKMVLDLHDLLRVILLQYKTTAPEPFLMNPEVSIQRYLPFYMNERTGERIGIKPKLFKKFLRENHLPVSVFKCIKSKSCTQSIINVDMFPDEETFEGDLTMFSSETDYEDDDFDLISSASDLSFRPDVGAVSTPTKTFLLQRNVQVEEKSILMASPIASSTTHEALRQRPTKPLQSGITQEPPERVAAVGEVVQTSTPASSEDGEFQRNAVTIPLRSIEEGSCVPVSDSDSELGSARSSDSIQMSSVRNLTMTSGTESSSSNATTQSSQRTSQPSGSDTAGMFHPELPYPFKVPICKSQKTYTYLRGKRALATSDNESASGSEQQISKSPSPSLGSPSSSASQVNPKKRLRRSGH